MPDTFPALSGGARELLLSLHEYRRRFRAAADGYDGSTGRAAELEQVMADYSVFVTDERGGALLTELERDGSAGVPDLMADLRAESARCAAVMEKYRALKLLEGRAESAGYFANVESCIEQEFGAVELTPASNVLLVGSGSFPMTLLNLAERTGASAVGVDVDAEAVDLGRRVVQLLGSGLDITLENVPAEDLPFTRRATHVIFSSTVEAKYDLLHRLHPSTRDDVVVAMRFGNGLKSLFNYPMQEVDPERWHLIETIRRRDQVFDIAVYVKQLPGREVR
ncbi:class I SAM-dependent methyltransferase [Pseudonocardia alaniniphila]|uniref:SAM-dependent methyltransferase n=1 Tax=Pseudonocardia alaniniphila TaxID=75291 RepID=A0ABS9TRV5_9PSEU|nr:SAM-dependent methyltransferase [Pseudonocardia alaniniphila]MCH6171290.1 SAM-dependent methyltransferase [Pseudonocardia alaniniphila]